MFHGIKVINYKILNFKDITFTIDWVMPLEFTRGRGAGEVSIVWWRASAIVMRLVTLSSLSMSLSMSLHKISLNCILCKSLLVHMVLKIILNYTLQYYLTLLPVKIINHYLWGSGRQAKASQRRVNSSTCNSGQSTGKSDARMCTSWLGWSRQNSCDWESSIKWEHMNWVTIVRKPLNE